MECYMIKEETLKGIADSVRERTGIDELLAVEEVAPLVSSLRPPYGEVISDISNISLGANGSIVDGKVVSTSTDTKTFMSLNFRSGNWDGENVYYIQKITPEMCPITCEIDISYLSGLTLYAKHNGTKNDIRLFSIAVPARPVKLVVEVESANPTTAGGVVISNFYIREE